jgi:hypothetical protein
MNQDSDRKREYAQSFLLEKAQSKGIPLDPLVNDLLKRDIEAFHARD